ncbi:uncharacterized protein B0T23DRAFT_387252 [Neurospora hispaniola]|uniref:Uncharacterized protein n=1 Tax=Neurospora hispaniola TaxID=588809 RepID=A0AAJ0MNQ6_9PEZI|nr:hypothetical protein B0T23DRAFT_387252 [Neurospora hispaniola]
MSFPKSPPLSLHRTPIDVGLVEWWPPFTSQRSHPPARALETCPSCHSGSLPDKSESSSFSSQPGMIAGACAAYTQTSRTRSNLFLGRAAPVPVIRNPARCPSLQMDANINRVPWERGVRAPRKV